MNGHTISLLGKIVVPVAVICAFALFRKYLPATSIEESNEEYSYDQLNGRFQTTARIFNFCMIGVGCLFVWSTHAALVWINRHLAALDGPVAFSEFPQSAIWWMFPGFGALALSYEITLQAWSLFGNRRDADLYSEWSNKKMASKGGRNTGIDFRRVLRWLFIVVALPVGILTILALPMHVSIGEGMIRDCGYAFSSCKTYSYSSARRMTIIEGFRDKDSKFTKRAGIVIDFNDGRRWSSADMGNFRQNIDPELADFLKKKILLSVNYAETETDIPTFESGH